MPACINLVVVAVLLALARLGVYSLFLVAVIYLLTANTVFFIWLKLRACAKRTGAAAREHRAGLST